MLHGRQLRWAFSTAMLLLTLPHVASAADPTEVESEGFVIRGRCRDNTRTPVADVRVQLFVATSRTEQVAKIGETTSDENGRFRFEHLEPPAYGNQADAYRAYMLVGTAAEYASSIRRIFSAARHVTDLTLYERGTLQGVVKNEAGLPVANATVYWGGADGQSPSGIQKGTTDEDGRFVLPDVPAFEPREGAKVFFQVEHPDYGKQRVGTSRINKNFEVVLKPPAIIESGVFDALTRRPASDVFIYAQFTNESQEYAEAQTSTDEGGRFRILMPPGVYNIWASLPGRTSVAIDSFRASEGSNVAADLKLIAGGFIEGRLLDSDGNPVGSTSERQIQIGLHGPSRPTSGAAVETTPVKEDGSFRFRVPPGENYPYVMSAGISADRDPTNVYKSQPVIVEEGETVKLDIHVGG